MPASGTTAPAAKGKLYRVEVGAPQTRGDADQLAADLKAKGFAARITAEGGIFHVQAGVYRDRQNAERQADRLGQNGYPATIAGGPGE